MQPALIDKAEAAVVEGVAAAPPVITKSGLCLAAVAGRNVAPTA